MDYQEARRLLHPDTTRDEIWKIADKQEAIKKINEACVIACDAIDELQEYKQLGTLDEVREAMEKQKKKKPKGDLHSVPHYRCPNCNSTVKIYQNSKKDEICKWCGQRIEWSEVENER